jgi:hypothetical protein
MPKYRPSKRARAKSSVKVPSDKTIKRRRPVAKSVAALTAGSTIDNKNSSSNRAANQQSGDLSAPSPARTFPKAAKDDVSSTTGSSTSDGHTVQSQKSRNKYAPSQAGTAVYSYIGGDDLDLLPREDRPVSLPARHADYDLYRDTLKDLKQAKMKAQPDDRETCRCEPKKTERKCGYNVSTLHAKWDGFMIFA